MADIIGFLWHGAEGKHFRLSDPSVGNLEFDCLDAETHDWKRDVTTNPVENASPIADHIIDQPDGLTITGMISNAPVMSYVAQFEEMVSGIHDDRISRGFDLLDNLRKSRELVTIYTRYRTYPDMLIQSISIPRTPDNGDAIMFTLQAIKVRIVTSQTTSLPKGLGVKKTTGKSNSKDANTRKRAGENKDNGKASQDIDPLQGGFQGATKLYHSVRDAIENLKDHFLGKL